MAAAALREPFFAAASSAGFLRSMSSIEPPAFSTASRAPLDTPATLKRQLGLELALAEQANAVLAAAREAGGLQRVMVERALGVELAGIDRLLDRADVHLGIIAREDVVEAALRQPHVERHLAALEAGDR